MKINVLGSGYMGKQICSLFVALGFDVILWRNSPENLDDLLNNEIKKIEKFFNLSHQGKFFIEDNLENLDSNFTIESITEDINIKKSVISKLKYNKNIYSNTSSLSANLLGNNINILHFMNPITIPIIELYESRTCIKADLEKVIRSLEAISYNIIRVQNTPGFLVNRILFKNISYFFYLLEKEKIKIDDLKKIYKNLFNIDPIKIVNMIGLDTCLNILINLNKSDNNFYVPDSIKKSVKSKILGYKNKKLFRV